MTQNLVDDDNLAALTTSLEAFQALTLSGKRRTLATLLPKSGPLSLVQADAWLDASHDVLDGPDWIDRVDPNDVSLPAAVRDGWLALLRAEAALAFGGSAPQPATLSALADAPVTAGSTFAEAMSRRLAERAVSALVRLSLAQFSPDPRPLDTPAGLRLPSWERDYLRGLVRSQASADLEIPYPDGDQTAVRLARATAMAKRSPEEALQALECPEPTWEVLVTRAALLARLGRCDEARQALTGTTTQPGPGYEAARCRWAQATSQYRRQEALLRAALAEERGDWAAAKTAMLLARGGPTTEAVTWSRRLWTASAELDALGDGGGWRRSAVEQDRQHAAQKVGAIPLTGDALFFRAVARFESRPDVAVRDAQTLSRQRMWLEREAAVGGGRLVTLGDLLLRLGCVDDAHRVYRRAGAVPDRLAVARIFVAVRGGRQPEPADLEALGLPTDLASLVSTGTGLDGEEARLATLARKLGGRWLTECPYPPEWAARRLLAAWCDDGNWAEALAFAETLARSGHQWAVDVHVLVRLRHALARAERGELNEATQEINALS